MLCEFKLYFEPGKICIIFTATIHLSIPGQLLVGIRKVKQEKIYINMCLCVKYFDSRIGGDIDSDDITIYNVVDSTLLDISKRKKTT